MVDELCQRPVRVRCDEPDIVAVCRIESEVVRVRPAATVEVGLIEDQITQRREHRAVRDAELFVVTIRVAQVPAAEIDRLTGRIEEFDRVDLRQVGVSQHFIDDDTADRADSRRAGRAVNFGARSPMFRVIVVTAGRHCFERTAESIRSTGPRTAVVVRHVEQLRAVVFEQLDRLAAVAERASELTGDRLAESVSRLKRVAVLHDENPFARRERLIRAVREVELNPFAEPQPREVDDVRSDVLQFDEFGRLVASRVVVDFGDRQVVFARSLVDEEPRLVDRRPSGPVFRSHADQAGRINVDRCAREAGRDQLGIETDVAAVGNYLMHLDRQHVVPRDEQTAIERELEEGRFIRTA